MSDASDKPSACRECHKFSDVLVYDPPRHPCYNCARFYTVVAPGAKACGFGRKKALPKTNQTGLF
jgi:hypothetical protein